MGNRRRNRNRPRCSDPSRTPCLRQRLAKTGKGTALVVPQAPTNFVTPNRAASRRDHEPRVPHISRSLRDMGLDGLIPLGIWGGHDREGLDFSRVAARPRCGNAESRRRRPHVKEDQTSLEYRRCPKSNLQQRPRTPCLIRKYCGGLEKPPFESERSWMKSSPGWENMRPTTAVSLFSVPSPETSGLLVVISIRPF
jgi:hypothetical protein